MLFYKVWQCQRCETVINVIKGSEPWESYTWEAVGLNVACCESPHIRQIEYPTLVVELPDDNDEIPEPKRFDRVELVLEDMGAG